MDATSTPSPHDPTRPDPPGSASWLAEAPAKLGPYRIVRELGRGGMGIVFEGADDSLARKVALKVLGPWLVGRADAEARLEAEARSLARIRHPGVVQVFGAGREGQLFYFAMEYVDGVALSEKIRTPRPSAKWTLEVGAQIAEALVAAHEAGIIHRDLKPENILVERDGRIRVADFGLAYALGGSRLTASGQVLGTPTYMAPEQVLGKEPTPASDVYALGAVLYEMIAGMPPFEAETALATAMKKVQEDPRDVRGLNPDTPSGLGELVMRCLVRSPEERPTSS